MAVAQDKGVTAAGRPQRRADRDRLGDHRRRLDPRRPRPGHRQLSRRASDRADRQGAARGLADHPDDDRSTARRSQVKAISSLPAGAVPAFIGLLLIVAVLIEPYIIRRRVPARLWAWLRGRPPPPALDIGGVAIEGAQTKGAMATDTALTRARLRQVPRPARRAGDHPDRRPVAGRPLAAARLLVEPAQQLRDPAQLHRARAADDRPDLRHRLRRHRPLGRRRAGARRQHGRLFAEGAGRSTRCTAVAIGLAAGMLAGAINALVTVGFGLPAFIATLGMFYIARGLAAWIVAGQQLTGWPEDFNLIGRKIGDILDYLESAAPPRASSARSPTWSACRPSGCCSWRSIAGMVLGYMPFGQQVYATGGNRRAADYAGINTNRVRFVALLFCGALRDDGRHHQRRLLPQLQSGRRPVPRARRASPR